MDINVEQIVVRKGLERSGEPFLKHHKIYIEHKSETIAENLSNRLTRDYTTYKKEVLPKVMEAIKQMYHTTYKNISDSKWGWRQNCGCSACGCSPGFVGNEAKGDVYTITVMI